MKGFTKSISLYLNHNTLNSIMQYIYCIMLLVFAYKKRTDIMPIPPIYYSIFISLYASFSIFNSPFNNTNSYLSIRHIQIFCCFQSLCKTENFQCPQTLLYHKKIIYSLIKVLCFFISCMSQVIIYETFTSKLFCYFHRSLSTGYLILHTTNYKYRTLNFI